MSYTVEAVNAPETVTVGDEFQLTTTVICSTSAGQCSEEDYVVRIEGVIVGSDSFSLAQGSVTYGINGVLGPEPQDDPRWTVTGFETMKFNEPGRYEISASVGSASNSTVVEAQSATADFDSGAVSVTNCSMPSVVGLGDDVTLAATVQNENDTAAQATVNWRFTATNRTTEVRLGANDTATAEVTITADEAFIRELGFSPDLEPGGSVETNLVEARVEAATQV